MSILQPLSGMSDMQGKIRGVLGLNMNHSLQIPSCGTILSFSGVLLACEDMVVQVCYALTGCSPQLEVS